MINVSIADFARNGQFGLIALGDSRNSLGSLLGDPDDWGVSPKSLNIADIWKYGDIEFYFDDSDILYMIFADTFDVPNGGTSMMIDPWVVRMHLDHSTFKDALQEIGISYSIVALSYLSGQIDIKTIGNVEFRFQIEIEDEFDCLGLQSFCLRKNAT